MKKIFAAITASFLISGCSVYNYNGEQFSTQADAYYKQDSLISEYIDSIKPLDTPLSPKEITVGIPSRSKLMDMTYGGIVGRKYLVNIFDKEYSIFKKAIEKRNIYSSVNMVRTNGEEITPSPGRDVFYLFVTENNKNLQWYAASDKNGKQAISIDQGMTDYADRVDSVVKQIEAFAIQNAD